ncbi:hypothetical protein FHS14_004741 [Paenibacillus baekrokdamisoli]|uniref:hypothetical protein n=1 Tax=Paenibacillus baekrokdamisoli TaxID=1712516 RepID=UPI0013DEA241|nr:hypothetical protein [Paenibacillus baekrokdamisoli]MBB3071732.1 hypothetical protein [Paenibacillus baekrokdamisoli]
MRQRRTLPLLQNDSVRFAGYFVMVSTDYDFDPIKEKETLNEFPPFLGMKI